jgi:hypothetical protein
MYYITIYARWSCVPLQNRVATKGTEAECLDSARELVDLEVKGMCNEATQYELSVYKSVVEGTEITVTFNVRTVDPHEQP